MEVSDLKELGLTNQESKIYLALISLGKSSASIIAREAKTSYGTIYEILAQMERKGLVEVVPEKTKKFIAVSPNKLMLLVKEKERRIKNLKEGINNLHKKYEYHSTPATVVAHGKSNFYRLKEEMAKTKKRDYSLRPVLEYRPASWRKMNKSIKEGVDFKILYGPSVKNNNLERFQKKGINLAKAPIDSAAISINDCEVLITLKKKNSTVLIKDKDFSNLMAWFFKKAFK